MRKLNDYCKTGLILLCMASCSNTTSPATTGNEAAPDTPATAAAPAPIKSECSEIEGRWRMFNNMSARPGNKGLVTDTTITLQIRDCKIWKLKKDKPLDSADLIRKLEPTRVLYEWSGVKDRYIRYAAPKDILILNIKGFEGGIEHYRRVK